MSHLTLQLVQRGFDPPLRIFVSDMVSPHDKMPDALSDVPDEEFFALNCEKYGLDAEYKKDKVYQDHIKESLRSDWKLVESYPSWYQQQIDENQSQKLNCPITVFYPTSSKCTTEQTCENWKEHTTGDFKVTKLANFESLFFYKNDKRRILVEHIMTDLQK